MAIEHNSRKIIQRLKADGWEEVSTKGSHHKFRKGGETIIVPHPRKDLGLGLARVIAKQAGWLSTPTNNDEAGVEKTTADKEAAADKEQNL